MARRKQHEEHGNHEAWAIPYADLMTLLLAFFVVMYAISSVNEGKYRVLADSLASAFSGAPRSIDPVQVGDARVSETELSQPMPIPSAAAGGSRPPVPVVDAALAPLVEARARAERGERGPGEVQLANSRNQLARLALQLEDEMADLIRTRTVTIHRSDLWLEVEINSDILFDTASDSLEASAQALLSRLARLLRNEPNPVRVEGHTDNRPISSLRFPSNWELSAARAASVVHLFVREQVAPERLVMVGYGEHRPKADNADPVGQNANRRVVLMVLASPDVPGARHPDAPPVIAADGPPRATVPVAAADPPDAPIAVSVRPVIEPLAREDG